MQRDIIKKQLFNFIISFVVFTTWLIPFNIFASSHSSYPRLANYFLRLDRLTDYKILARNNIVILPVETVVLKPDLAQKLRQENPNIKILAYVPAQSFHQLWSDSVHDELMAGIQDSFWLRDPRGNVKYLSKDLKMLNVSSGWADYLAEFVSFKVLSNPYWDGVFYDMVDHSISWLEYADIDINNDGIKDSPAFLDKKWVDGMTYLVQKTRANVPNSEIVINGSSHPQLQPDVNGRMYENFPTPWHDDGTWRASIQSYIDSHSISHISPSIFILNTDTNASDGSRDYRRMRYGLASTLLGNGYFSFDYGAVDHGSLWWFDEYDVDLGLPLDVPVNLNSASTSLTEGVWLREFENGIVVVNSTNKRKKVSLNAEYEKIHGKQDPFYNDGMIVDKLFMEPQDGIILLKRHEDILNSSLVNTSFVRNFNEFGDSIRTGFFYNKKKHASRSQIHKEDINRNGSFETVVADYNKIEVFSNIGESITEFYPYTKAYKGRISYSVGDINGDGTVEVVTGTAPGGGPHLRVFNIDGRLINPGFFAYSEGFRGGVNVALCDTNGNGTREIVTAAGPGGGPHIRVFNKDGRLLSSGFFAYSRGYSGGVQVGCGDINNDGKEEIITATMQGAALIKVFTHQGRQIGKTFTAFENSNANDIYISAYDINNDGREEIIAQTLNYFDF